LAFGRRKEKSSWASVGPNGGRGVDGLRRPIGQPGWCEAFGPREERGCSGPRWAKRPGGPCTLKNQPSRKNEKKKKIKDGLQGTFWAGWKLGRGGRKEKKRENVMVGLN
jgi:hypothetical protein